MFQAVFAWAQPLMELLSYAFAALGQLVHDTLPAGLLQSFLQNGVISGVGSVIVFLPQIIIIFLFILLLEDFGYMARAAFLMDRIMGGAGLHGRAFIPAALKLCLRHSRHHGDARHRQSPRPADHDPDRAADDLLGAHPGLHVDHLRLHSRRTGLGLGRSAGPRDVRPLCGRHLQRVGRFVPDQVLHVARLRAGAVHAGIARLQNAPRAQHRDRHLYAGEDVPAAGRHHDLLDDGADLVPGVVSDSRPLAPKAPPSTTAWPR